MASSVRPSRRQQRCDCHEHMHMGHAKREIQPIADKMQKHRWLRHLRFPTEVFGGGRRLWHELRSMLCFNNVDQRRQGAKRNKCSPFGYYNVHRLRSVSTGSGDGRGGGSLWLRYERLRQGQSFRRPSRGANRHTTQARKHTTTPQLNSNNPCCLRFLTQAHHNLNTP